MLRDFKTRLRIFLEGARQRGLFITVTGRICSTLGAFVIWALLLPLTVTLHLFGYRCLTVITGRIGHLAAEVDSFLKSLALGELPQRRWLLLAPPGQVANSHLLSYWETHLPVVSSPFLCALLGAMSRWIFLRYDVGHYVLQLNATQDIYRLNTRWAGRPPLLALTEADRSKCQSNR